MEPTNAPPPVQQGMTPFEQHPVETPRQASRRRTNAQPPESPPPAPVQTPQQPVAKAKAPPDPELRAMRRVLAILDELDSYAARRVVTWAGERTLHRISQAQTTDKLPYREPS